MQEVALSYEHDPTASQLLTELIVDPTTQSHYTLHQGIIIYDTKIFVGRRFDMRVKIFKA